MRLDLDLPNGLEGTIGHLWNESTPVICSGFGFTNLPLSVPFGSVCDCFFLINVTWTSGAKMRDCRSFSASIHISSKGENGQEMLLVSGGISENKDILSSVEVFHGTDWKIDESLKLPHPSKICFK